MFNKRMTKALAAQKKSGLYRNPPVIDKRDNQFVWIRGKKYLNFASNDYLGLGCADKTKALAAKHFNHYGSSASSSRLVSGNYSQIRESEKKYADYFGFEDALFFPSGYQANIGLLSALFHKNDTLIFDKHIHASSVRGIQLSGAGYTGFKHNRLSHLEKKLISADTPHKAVITESLFSMDGDTPDFSGYSSLKNNYGFLSIVDEAHALGALGDKGKGLAGKAADIITGTLGKAFGLFGAFLLLSSLTRDYLINFSSPQIYTTTLPEAHAAIAGDILDLVEKSDDKRHHLATLSHTLKNQLREIGYSVSGDAHIVAIEIGAEAKAVALSEMLFKQGIFAFTARFPTVPVGKAILRLSLTAMHTPDDINTFIHTLEACHDPADR